MADWTAVYPWIADCLQERGLDDPNGYDRHIASQARRILKAPLTYDTLLAADKDAVDEALGKLTAASVHGQLTTGGVSTDLRSEDDGESKRAFEGDIAAQWRAEAMTILRTTSFGGGTGVATTAGAVNGPSRQRCGDRCYEVDGCRGGRWPY